MKDSDPRPMPSSVKAAYRQPIDLLGLLTSSAYATDDRKQVRDELLEALVREKGNVHLPHSKNETRTITEKCHALKDPVSAINFVLSVPDYGGMDETMPYLARAMEPRWIAWWHGQAWARQSDIFDWVKASKFVMGQRQYVWIAAQYARTVLEYNTATNRSEALKAIQAAEDWSTNQSIETVQLANAIYLAVSDERKIPYTKSYAACALHAARETVRAAAHPEYGVVFPGEVAVSVASDAVFLAGEGTPFRLSVITRWLITPSLVDAR